MGNTTINTLPTLRGPWKTLYTDSTGLITDLSLGAAGTVLQSTGASGAPVFDVVATAKDTAIAVTQNAHGFLVGDILRLSGSTYVKAQADSVTNAEVIGMVLSITSTNNFVLTTAGYVTGLTGLTAGAVYYLSPTVAGTMTSTQTSTQNQVDKPVFSADSSTSGYFFSASRGVVITAQAAETSPTEAKLVSFKASADEAPNYLLAGGPSSLTATLDASASSFNYSVNGVVYEINSTVTFAVSAGLSSTNTMLVNEPSWTAASSQEQQSLVFGEKSHASVYIAFDNVGANLQAQFVAGDYGWFRGVNSSAAAEFVFGQVLTVGATVNFRPIWRGVDSANGTTTRIKFRDNDTFTFARPTYLFVDTNGTGHTSALLPLIVDTLGTVNGQYYKLNSDGLWYLGNGSGATVTSRVFIGVALSTTATGCQAVCYLPEFSHVLAKYQTVTAADLDIEISNSPTNTSKGLLLNGTYTVGTQKFVFNNKQVATSTAGDRETGTNDISAVGVKYVYLSPTGKPYFSDVMPRKLGEGILMHPSKMWRCIGWFFHSASAFYPFTYNTNSKFVLTYIQTVVSANIWTTSYVNAVLFSGYFPSFVTTILDMYRPSSVVNYYSADSYSSTTDLWLILSATGTSVLGPVYSGYMRRKTSSDVADGNDLNGYYI